MKIAFYIISLLAVFFLTSCSSQQAFQERYEGYISGFSFDEIRLNLKAGDTLSVQLSEPHLNIIIFSPISMTLENNEAISIQESGEYTLRVILPRAIARRGEHYHYQLLMIVNHSK